MLPRYLLFFFFYGAMPYFKHLFHTDNVLTITFTILLALRSSFLESFCLEIAPGEPYENVTD